MDRAVIAYNKAIEIKPEATLAWTVNHFIIKGESFIQEIVILVPFVSSVECVSGVE